MAKRLAKVFPMDYSVEATDMLPPEKPKTKMANTGMAVSPELLEELNAIVESEGVKSRNLLMGSFLAFAVRLFPLLKPLERRIALAQALEGVTRPEIIAHLVTLGLESYEKKHPKK